MSTEMKYARMTVVLLTGLNLVNYIDRYVLFSVQPLVQAEFHRSDAAFGFLTTAFIICYAIMAPFVGVLADRYPRKWIIMIGAMVWSAATLLTAFTYTFDELFLRHLLVGVGEATFVTIAPAFLSDLFSEGKRGRVLGIFYLAFGMGPGIGYLIGGYLGPIYGWRAPFYVAAIPGFILGVLTIFIPEPRRGASDTIVATRERASLRGLVHNHAFWSATLGMAMITFAIGGLSVWMPTFLFRARGIPLHEANYVFGGATLFNGIVATLIGGWLGDRMLRRISGAYYLISGLSMAVAIPLMYVAISTHGRMLFPAITLGEFFLLLNTAPLNAAVVDSVGAKIRASAIAVNIFTIHILGDASSPWIIGWISDHHSLKLGFLVTIVAVAIGAVILFYGQRFAPRINLAMSEQEKTGIIV
jgi:MFS transporter, Spinster family, sphingosine-1-phosphate transporter